MAEPEDFVEMGRVIDAYGVRGLLKVEAFGGPDSTLSKTRSVWLKRLDRSGDFGVRQWKAHSGNLILSLEGFADRDFAASWKGAVVGVSRAQFPASSDEEIYWVDLIGCRVNGAGSVDLGVVKAVNDHGGGPFLRVFAEPGVAGEPARERLIPFIKSYVTDVDLPNKLILADWDASWE